MSERSAARVVARVGAALVLASCTFPDPAFRPDGVDAGFGEPRCETDPCPALPLATGQGAITGVVADDRSVFWVSYPAGRDRAVVRSMALATRKVTDLAALGDGVGPMALDEGSVYATRSATGGNIYKVPRAGGDPTPLWDRTDVAIIRLDAGFVYYQAPYAIGRVSKTGVSGGALTQLAPAGSGLLDVGDDALLVWNAGRIVETSKDGTQPFTSAREVLKDVEVDGFARLGSRFYWTTSRTGSVTTWAPGDAQPRTLATGESVPENLLVDDGHLVWMDGASGTVRRMPRAGGAPETIGRGRAGPLAQNATALLWTSDADGGSLLTWAK